MLTVVPDGIVVRCTFVTVVTDGPMTMPTNVTVVPDGIVVRCTFVTVVTDGPMTMRTNVTVVPDGTVMKPTIVDVGDDGTVTWRTFVTVVPDGTVTSPTIVTIISDDIIIKPKNFNIFFSFFHCLFVLHLIARVISFSYSRWCLSHLKISFVYYIAIAD
jgi:hypothetical protein